MPNLDNSLFNSALFFATTTRSLPVPSSQALIVKPFSALRILTLEGEEGLALDRVVVFFLGVAFALGRAGCLLFAIFLSPMGCG